MNVFGVEAVNLGGTGDARERAYEARMIAEFNRALAPLTSVAWSPDVVRPVAQAAASFFGLLAYPGATDADRRLVTELFNDLVTRAERFVARERAATSDWSQVFGDTGASAP